MADNNPPYVNGEVLTQMNNTEKSDKVRVDKWLWAARFFKTRSLATDAINGGKVHVNQQRCKPSRAVQIGDTLTVRTGFVERTIIVQVLSTQRGPATVAATLYEETADSIERREQAAVERKHNAALQGNLPSNRPNKRDRRLIHRFKKEQGS